MFWDRVAGIYDIFVNVINGKTHKELKRVVADQINAGDEVLECACGTGLLSVVIAPRCKHLIATDFSANMLKKTKKNCAGYSNVSFKQANIMSLEYADETFDKVVAANVIHLLDEPVKAIRELDRVCKNGGSIIIPTYMNKDSSGKTSSFAKTIGKAGADFKRQFTLDTYQDFFRKLGYVDASYKMIEGRVPCAVAVIKKVRL
ncbi:MAG: class I SAM-dependent methyltransferase [Lachnospiraceae bacterium]|nr:class I SAM-dependent methyltransferase [Lachnospiraceae bacterium]